MLRTSSYSPAQMVSLQLPYSLHCTRSKHYDDSIESFLTLNGDLLLEDQKQQL